MGYYVTNIIGMRTGGIFSDPKDVEDIKQRIANIIIEMADKAEAHSISVRQLDYCMSQELSGPKGSYVILAGVFNYWTFDRSSVFSQRLSKEFGSEVIHFCWDEETNQVDWQIWLDGNPLFEEAENAEGSLIRMFRRVMG